MSGCGGTKAAARLLPYHVALAVRIPDGQSSNSPSETKEETGLFELDFDAQQVSQFLAQSLRETTFVRVTVLESPSEGDPAEGVSADVLALADLDYDPSIKASWPVRWYFNVPIFLLLGPASFLMDDVAYGTRVKIELRLYDVTRQEAILPQRAFLEERIQVEFEEASLNFVGRAGRDLKWYLAAIVCPTGFLANRSPNAQRQLEKVTLEKMARGLSDEIRRRQPLRISRRVASFGIEEEAARAVRIGDRVQLDAKFFLSDLETQNLAQVFVESPPGTRVGADSENGLGPVLDDGSYRIRRNLVVPPDAEFVRLIVIDGDGHSRGFTLRIETPAETLAETPGPEGS